MLMNFQNPFKADTNVSGYVVGAVLMCEVRHVSLWNISWAIFNYPNYDKDLYALVQAIQKWKHYFK